MRKIKDLEVNSYNKPIPIGTRVPTDWSYEDVVLAYALNASNIALIREEDTGHLTDYYPWKDAPVVERVPVWFGGEEGWYVQLSDSLFDFYELIQPETDVTVSNSNVVVLLHMEWKSLRVIQ